jgi:hypothetical protein
VTQNRLPPDPFDSLETVLASLKMMEATLLGMRRSRQYVAKGFSSKMFDSLIEEAESQVAEIKRKIIQ